LAPRGGLKGSMTFLATCMVVGIGFSILAAGLLFGIGGAIAIGAAWLIFYAAVNSGERR
jgi:hypothetical protein